MSDGQVSCTSRLVQVSCTSFFPVCHHHNVTETRGITKRLLAETGRPMRSERLRSGEDRLQCLWVRNYWNPIICCVCYAVHIAVVADGWRTLLSSSSAKPPTRWAVFDCETYKPIFYLQHQYRRLIPQRPPVTIRKHIWMFSEIYRRCRFIHLFLFWEFSYVFICVLTRSTLLFNDAAYEWWA